MIVAGRHRHSPVEAGARDAEILETALDEADDLVATALRTDEVGIGCVEIEQRLLILRQAEEPAFFDRPFDRRALRRQLRAVLGRG